LPSLTNVTQFKSTFTLVENVPKDVKFCPGCQDNKKSSFAQAVFIAKEGHQCKCDQCQNLYNVKDCSAQIGMCTNRLGEFDGPIFPSLMGKWKIEFKPSRWKKRIPYPVGVIKLKAKIEICYTNSKTRPASAKQWTSNSFSSKKCCAVMNKPKILSGNDCQACPPKSSPRLNGYYCESCPKGFEPLDIQDKGSYGCEQCPVNEFKSEDGDKSCKPCRAGQYTNGTMGATFCVDRL